MTDILKVQTALKAHYYEPGPLDGVLGKRTLLAAQAFAFEHALRKNTDGPLTAITEDLLHAIEGAPIWARGCDVAHYQDGTGNNAPVGDLVAAKASGISFVIVKAGGADGKSGDGLYTDSEYTRYKQQARAAGLIQGAYFFHHFSKDPVAQAEKFFQITGPLQSGDLPPALDVEDYATKIKGISATEHILRCLNRMETLYGVKPLLYTSASLLKTHSADFETSPLSAFPLWIPAYGVTKPDRRIPACYKGQWTIWQPGFDDALPGFGNDVDRDFFRGTVEDLQKICVP